MSVFPLELYIEIFTRVDDGATYRAWVTTCKTFNRMSNPRHVDWLSNHFATLVKCYPDEWPIEMLCRHPKLTPEFLIETLTLSSCHKYALSANPNMTPEFVQKHPDMVDLLTLECNNYYLRRLIKREDVATRRPRPDINIEYINKMMRMDWSKPCYDIIYTRRDVPAAHTECEEVFESAAIRCEHDYYHTLQRGNVFAYVDCVASFQIRDEFYRRTHDRSLIKSLYYETATNGWLQRDIGKPFVKYLRGLFSRHYLSPLDGDLSTSHSLTWRHVVNGRGRGDKWDFGKLAQNKFNPNMSRVLCEF